MGVEDKLNISTMQVFDLQQPDYDDGYANGTSNGTVDAAFKSIQKTSSAFLIWRIENMNVVHLLKEQYGTFYDSDSYIIYAASPYGQPSGTDTFIKEVRGRATEIHIHFWLGALTTPDKSGVAAYKTVELDGYLGGIATQHRETQGNESPRFKSYFKNGFRILKSGLIPKQLSSHFEPVLYKIKGKRSPIVIQLDRVSWDSFNSGDVFIIHTKDAVFVWIGRTANPTEKLHSVKIATQLKSEYNSTIIFVDDGYEQTLHDNDKKLFNRYLQLAKRHVLPEEQGGDDEKTEQQYRSNMRLYRCTDNGEKYRVNEIKVGPLAQNDLNSDDVFILDHGVNGIWVWVGKRASEKERSEAMRNARGFVKKKNYPNNTHVTRVVDGAEPVEFKMLFSAWKDKYETKGFGNANNGKATKLTVAKFDATTLQERPALSAETQLVDDGSGVVKIWRIKNQEITEISRERFGNFFSGDCYIILYNYIVNSNSRYIIYFWLGTHATKEEISCAALKATEMKINLGGSANLARIIQGREHAQLLQLFKGKLIIFKGKGTDYDESGHNSKAPSNYLLRVEGSTTYKSKAFQVHCKTNSLNSNYCFVLKKGKQCYIWCGNNSTGDQREMAKGFAYKEFELILEGKERSEFWEVIGGKGAYLTTKILHDANSHRPARLFQCSGNNGSFKADEIVNFTQNDLVPEDIMLLDAFDVIFIWVGELSAREKQKSYLDQAENYLKNDPAGRDIHVTVIQIMQGYEPTTFTGFFNDWNNSLRTEYKSFDEFRQEISGGSMYMMKKARSIDNTLQGTDDSFDQYDKYPVAIVKMPNDQLPSKINPLCKELHLTHDDFVLLFKVSYSEFESLPKWKQQEMKKKVGLF